MKQYGILKTIALKDWRRQILNTYYLTFKYSEIYSMSEYMVNVIVELKLQSHQANDRITVTE